MVIEHQKHSRLRVLAPSLLEEFVEVGCVDIIGEVEEQVNERGVGSRVRCGTVVRQPIRELLESVDEWFRRCEDFGIRFRRKMVDGNKGINDLRYWRNEKGKKGSGKSPIKGSDLLLASHRSHGN